MSLPTCRIGLSGILGIVFVVAGLAVADERDPGYIIVNGKRVPLRVEPSGPDGLAAQRGTHKQAREVPAVMRSGRDQGREPRVTVRDLRDWPYSSDGRGPRDPRPQWTPGRLPRELLYVPYGGSYWYGLYRSPRWWADAYRSFRYEQRKERERRLNRREMAERKERLLTQHDQALAAGLERLKDGEVARAIVAFTLAAKLNQGDPACRIHLAQARLAQGHYREAGLALRRALQLQPKLIYADLRLDKYYQQGGDLSKHTESLRRWLQDNPARPEVYFLLGFLEFQGGDFAAAHAAFGHVRTAWPDDDLTRDYCEITKPATQ